MITSKTISTDDEKWEQVKQLGYSHSDIHNLVMDMVLSEEMDSFAYDFQIELMRKLISERRDSIERLENRLVAEMGELACLEEKLRVLETEKAEDMAILELSRSIGRLNQIIVLSDYNVEAVKATANKLIKRIMELNPAFDIKKHCGVLKTML